jgi:hypothetical protein
MMQIEVTNGKNDDAGHDEGEDDRENRLSLSNRSSSPERGEEQRAAMKGMTENFEVATEASSEGTQKQSKVTHEMQQKNLVEFSRQSFSKIRTGNIEERN